jgi:hypothetical protein
MRRVKTRFIFLFKQKLNVMKLTKQQINIAVNNADISAHNFDDLLDLFDIDENDALDSFNNVLSTFKIEGDESIAALIDMIIIGQVNDDVEYGEGELVFEEYFKSRAKAYEIRDYAINLLV